MSRASLLNASSFRRLIEVCTGRHVAGDILGFFRVFLRPFRAEPICLPVSLGRRYERPHPILKHRSVMNGCLMGTITTLLPQRLLRRAVTIVGEENKIPFYNDSPVTKPA